MTNRARAEWDPLREVLIHRPGIEMFFGLTEPYSFLYERAFSIDEAIYEHTTLEHALTEAGVEVQRLKRFAVDVEAKHPDFLDRVRNAILGIVHYTGPKAMVERAKQALRRNLDRFDAETLFNFLLLRPSVHLERHPGYRIVLPEVRLEVPLANLYFMRDQQALSRGGFILGRMSKPQRANEPLLTGTLLKVGGCDIAGEVRAPGTFEGGDFMPMGSFALIGNGDRTNEAGIRQILAMPIGFDEVGVVHQPSHPAIPGNELDPMIDMHLDTYFNVPGDGLAVGCTPLLTAARVDVYHRHGRRGLVREPKTVSLTEYLKAKHFDVIPISTLEQMSYASNFLCLKDRHILAVEVEQEIDRVLATLAQSARADPRRYNGLLRLARRERAELSGRNEFFPHLAALRDHGVEATPLGLREITGGYGGAHCMTCVLRRSN